jgi:signal transduction histidine kinase
MPGRNRGSRCLAWLTWMICSGGCGRPACLCTSSAAAQARTPPPDIQLAVFRLVQEALTNTMKHAGPGASAAVRLQLTSAEIHVDVEDDGAGGGAVPGAAGGGLTGMRERISTFGGDLDFGPRDTRGWRVTARLSLDPVATS